VVLVAQAGTESTKIRIFCQATSFWAHGAIMLSEKLLEVVGVNMLSGENGYWEQKSTAQSARSASFRPLAVTSGPVHHLGAFSSEE
jgi:hypothetical protein